MVENKTEKENIQSNQQKEQSKSHKGKYIEAVGRRKESVARVRLSKGEPNIIINGLSLAQYFPIKENQEKVISPLKKAKMLDKFLINVKVIGGGTTGQAEAIRLGISRALVKFNEGLKTDLRKVGFLTRDAREVERKKYGLKKARRAPQWQKR